MVKVKREFDRTTLRLNQSQRCCPSQRSLPCCRRVALAELPRCLPYIATFRFYFSIASPKTMVICVVRMERAK